VHAPAEATESLQATTFFAICAYWRGLGVWLSLWDRHGHCVLRDEDGPPFFELMWRYSPKFRDWLRSLSLKAHEPDNHPSLIRGELAGLLAFAMPICPAGTVDHVMLAALVPKRFKSGPEFASLCDRAGIQVEMAATLAEDIAWHDIRATAAMQELLVILAGQASRTGEESQVTANLAANLAQTYEVLNLIYHIAGRLEQHKQPNEFFERVFAEVVGIIQVETLAVVTHLNERMQKPMVAITGKGGPRKEQIAELARVLADSTDEATTIPRNVIRHRVKDADWIKQLAVAALMHQDRKVGLVLAINKTDGKEFDEVDLQLLKVISDRCSIYLEDLQLFSDLQELLVALLRSLVNSIDATDPYTSGHSERVALIARRLAEQTSDDPLFCQQAYFAGLLHDIGKIAIPPSILRKPGSLTPEELELIKQHPVNGAKLIHRIRPMHEIVPGILCHHERIDGKGYPFGISGSDLPVLGRIVAVADCFDAMTSQRAYRPAKPLETVRREMARMAGRHLDADLVHALIDMDLHALADEIGSYRSGLLTDQTHQNLTVTA